MNPLPLPSPSVTELAETGVVEVRQEINWIQDYPTWKPNGRLDYDDLHVAHCFTGVPSRGWCLYSRAGTSCWQQLTKAEHSPWEVGEVYDGRKCVDVRRPQRDGKKWFWVGRFELAAQAAKETVCESKD